MKIVHIITGLGLGGAEAMLAKLVGGSSGCRHVVVSLTDRGAGASAIEAAGGAVHTLNIGTVRGLVSGLPRLVSLLRRERPDLIQGWLNHGNLFALLGAALARSPAPVVYNVRQSLLGMRFEKWPTRQVIRLNGWLSARTAAVIYNSRTGAHDHESIGYDSSKRRLVPNGFDLNHFFPAGERREEKRRELGISDDEVVVGLIARFHPWKNHLAFFEAASKIVTRHPETRFLLAGKDMAEDNAELVSLIVDPEVRSRCLLLGPRTDMADLNRALDIACNVSHGEGFPNSIGEAMASGVPCVVTDVSDMRDIVGDTGRVCRTGDPALIASAVMDILSLDKDARQELGRSARCRIKANFSLSAIVSQYETIYDEIVRKTAVPSAGKLSGQMQ